MDTEYLKKVGKYILTILVCIGTVFYLGYHVWHSLTRDIETTGVTDTEAEFSEECDGYIFRSETLLYKTTAGESLVPSVKEGGRVCRGGEVAKIYAVSSPQTVSRIAEIEEEISMLEECSSVDNVSLKESTKIDKDIFSALSGIRDASDSGDAVSAISLRPTLLSLINKRAVLTGQASGFAEEISALQSEKTSLCSQLGAAVETISTASGGYYYSQADGFEEVFRAKDLNNITYDKLSKLVESSPKSLKGNAGKVVTDSYWYLVVSLDKKYVETFKEGKDATVKFSGDLTLEMNIDRILKGSSDIVLILKTNYIPENFNFDRMQRVSVVTKIYKGFKVAANAVRIVNGQSGVYVLDGATIHFRKIEILFKADNYYIVNPDPDKDKTEEEIEKENEKNSALWLQYHDNLIIKGKGLYDGRVIGE